MEKEAQILIIEDEPIIARNLEMILSAKDYRVAKILYAKEEALNSIASENFDLVLLDLNLEGDFEGLEIADKLQKVHKVPFIFITSYATKEIIEKAKIYCPLGYIVKPFEADEIYANVEIALYTHSLKSGALESLESINKQISNPLTRKEYEVLIELTSAMKYKEIADKLSISINTLNTHVKSIFSKFYIHSRAEVVPFLRRLK